MELLGIGIAATALMYGAGAQYRHTRRLRAPRELKKGLADIEKASGAAAAKRDDNELLQWLGYAGLRRVWGSASLAALVAVGAPQAAQTQQAVAFIGVTVVDAAATPVSRANYTVLVDAGRIVAVGPQATVTLPANVRRVNATGQFLIPGLWDAHVHFMNATAAALPMFVANGVTSVREMGGFLDSTRAWQARMRAGTLVGPRLVTPGGVLEDPRYLAGVRERSARLDGRLAPRILPYRAGIADSTDARRVIDSVKALGVDFIKFRTVTSPAAFFAVLREARRVGLKVAGHSPGRVPVAVAADSGQHDIEHALSITDTATRAQVTRTLVARGTWYTPTLVVARAAAIAGDSAQRLVFGPRALSTNVGRQYAAPWLLDWWRMQIDERVADTANTGATRNAAAFAASRDDVRAFAAAGVRMLAGTDAGSVLVYPGFSLHDELELLVEAGLSTQQALWSSTIGPAQFAGVDATVGRIAPGYVADLVLLSANPLASIGSTRRIRAVMQAGHLYDRAALDAMLAAVRKQVGSR